MSFYRYSNKFDYIIDITCMPKSNKSFAYKRSRT